MSVEKRQVNIVLCLPHYKGREESKCVQAGSDKAVCSVPIVTVLNSAKQRGTICLYLAAFVLDLISGVCNNSRLQK